MSGILQKAAAVVNGTEGRPVVSATKALREEGMKERAAETAGHMALTLSTGVALHSAHTMGYEKEATYAAAALFIAGGVAKVVKPEEGYTDVLSTVGNAAGAAQVARFMSDKLLDWTGARPAQGQTAQFGQFDDEMRAFGSPANENEVAQVNGGMGGGRLQ